jgi:hypothetical protein
MDVVMTEGTPIENEAEITFGMVKAFFYWFIFNMRASFPDAIIVFVLFDIKACFRFPRIHPNLTGAFRLMVNNLYCLATSMIFGSSISATRWESILRTIEGLIVVFANFPDLVEKHKYYIDMLRWNVATGNEAKPGIAITCALNPCVLDSARNQMYHPARIWADDT